MLRKVVLSLILIVVLLVSGFVAIELGIALRPTPEREERGAAPLAVRVERLEQGDVVEQVRGFGLAEPIRRARVAARVSGRLVEMNESLRVGRRLSAGDVVARIDPLPYEAAVARAVALVAETGESIRKVDSDIEENARKRELVESDLEIARSEVRRATELFEEGVASESARDQAISALRTVEQRLSDIDREAASLRIERVRFEATLRARSNDLKIAEADLDYTTIRAPFDGIIEERVAEKGDVLSPGQTVIVLVDPSALELPIEVPASQARSLAIGAAAELRTDETPPRLTRGTVERIAPTIAPNSRTVSVYITIPNQRGEFDPGTFLTAEVAGRRFEDVYSVPRRAIVDGRIFLARNGVAALLQPRFFVYLDDVALTRDDLGDGSLLITTGLEQIYEGAPVTIPDASPAAPLEAPPAESLSMSAAQP